MFNKNKQITSEEQIFLLVGVALVFGFLVRFLPGLQAGFPLNDGGMFMSMVRDLGASGYRLPEFTTYNRLEIPYAYPPFGFYFGRLLADVLHISELDVLRWLPPAVHALSIFIFYLLATDLLKSKLHGALASTFYALTPGAYGWFVMGGGLTRSFGALFLLLTILAVFRLFQRGGGKYLALSIIFGGLTVLSHPEAGIHAAVTCALLWIFYGRTLQTFGKAAVVGVGVFFFTLPWWWTVISYHGFAPILSALQTGMHGQPFWLGIYNAIFSSGIAIPILAVLRLAGIVWALWKRQYFLIAWVVMPYLVEPRSAPSISFYPLTLLSALAFADAIPHVFRLIRRAVTPPAEFHKNKALTISLFIVLMYLFVESGLYGFRLVGNSLKPADITAMEWIRANTADDASFLPLTGVPSPEIDPFVEWFPALTERRSQSTIQGYEWLLGSEFFGRYASLRQLQTCATVTCVEAWSASTGLAYDHVVIRDGRVEGLLADFEQNGGYERIFSADNVFVLKRLP